MSTIMGRCKIPDANQKVCGESTCRWWMPAGTTCKDCELGAQCANYDEIDESNQLTLDFE